MIRKYTLFILVLLSSCLDKSNWYALRTDLNVTDKINLLSSSFDESYTVAEKDWIFFYNKNNKIIKQKILHNHDNSKAVENESFLLSNSYDLHSKFIVDDLSIYLVDAPNILVSLDKNTLQEKWRLELTSVTNNDLVVDNMYVFAHSMDGSLTAINKHTGLSIWRKEFPKPSLVYNKQAAPLLYKDNIIFSTAAGKIYSLQKLDGKVNWQQDTKLFYGIKQGLNFLDIDFMAINKENNRLILQSKKGLIFCLSPYSGDIFWSKHHSDNLKIMCLFDDKILLSAKNKILASQQLDGSDIWKKEIDNFGYHRYFTSTDTKIYGFGNNLNFALVIDKDDGEYTTIPFNSSSVKEIKSFAPSIVLVQDKSSKIHIIDLSQTAGVSK